MSRSIIGMDAPGRCYICSMARTIRATEMDREIYEGMKKTADKGPIEEHHIFGGPLRKKSEHYGLKVHLCAYHHREGKYAVHKNSEMDRRLKQAGQQAFENLHGHSAFMQEFGKNYLPEDRWVI